MTDRSREFARRSSVSHSVPKRDHAIYQWAPGQGPDTSALERMRSAFPRPKIAMGEAWFMGPKRRMFPELFEDLEALKDEEIIKPLEEMASGVACFGQQKEWTQWYHFLLPRLILRDWGPYCHAIEVLITGFMAQHPEQIDELPYPDFRADALMTLGRHVMAPHLWPGGVLDVEKCLDKYERVEGTFGWANVGGLLSASMFLCLKYLPTDAVGLWIESVLAISDPHWTAQIVTWLVGAHPILAGEIGQPKEFPEDGPFDVGWQWSHALSGNYSGRFDELATLSTFLPAQNRDAILGVVHRIATEGGLRDLWASTNLDHDLAVETAGLQDRFTTLYRHASSSGNHGFATPTKLRLKEWRKTHG